MFDENGSVRGEQNGSDFGESAEREVAMDVRY
jgi:hypothetical protein